MRKHFCSGVNIHKTRSFSGADIGSDHDLVMMSFRIRLKNARKPSQSRLRFDLKKLRDRDVACGFQATVGGKFTLICQRNDDVDIGTMINIYNTALIDVASEILGKEHIKKKSLGSPRMFTTSVMRENIFKKRRYKAEGANVYRKANKRIQKAMKKAKEDWIGVPCEDIETCLNKNNSKRAYQLLKDLTSEI